MILFEVVTISSFANKQKWVPRRMTKETLILVDEDIEND